jgi:hypothetical protein
MSNNRMYDFAGMKEYHNGQLREELSNLSTISPQKVAVLVNGEYKTVNNRVALWNDTYKTCNGIASDNYKIVQHEQCFGMLIDAIEKVGIEHANARVWENKDGAKAKLYLKFNELQFDGPDGKALHLGYKVTNSYDKTTGLRFDGFGIRQTCTNGMHFKHLVGSFSVRHLGGIEQVASRMRSALADLTSVIPAMKTVLLNAHEKELDYVQIEELLAGVGIKKRLRNKVMNQAVMEENTVWGAYNAVTWVASHTDKSSSQFDNLLGTAETLLTENTTNLVESGRQLMVMEARAQKV